jgi:hypothetical protein
MGYRHTVSKIKHPLFRNECHRPYGLSALELKTQLALGSTELDWAIASCVQRKCNTSSKILNVLADRKEPGIRWLVARHPNTSRSTRLRMRRRDVLASPDSKRDRRKKFRW